MISYDGHPTDYLPELALAVLDADDATEVRSHLDGCETCRRELAELEGVTALLPLAAEDTAPPASLREGLLERVRGEPRPIELEHARKSRPAWWLAAAAGLALVAVLGGAAGYLVGNRGGESQDERDAARGESLLTAAATGKLTMDRGGEGGTRAVVLRAVGNSAAFAWIESPPELPAGKAYQAWFTRDGVVFEPSTVFQSGGAVWLEAAGRIEEYAALGITIEDEDGATTPSQAPFVTVGLGKLTRVD